MVHENRQKKTSILRTSLIYIYIYIDTIAQHINFFGGKKRCKLDPFIINFMKTESDEYHKNMIPTQHWTKH